MHDEPRRKRAVPDQAVPDKDESANPETDKNSPRRRRRSMEDSGGISVSDLLSRNPGPPLRPVPQQERRAEPPRRQPPQRRPRPENPPPRAETTQFTPPEAPETRQPTRDTSGSDKTARFAPKDDDKTARFTPPRPPRPRAAEARPRPPRPARPAESTEQPGSAPTRKVPDPRDSPSQPQPRVRPVQQDDDPLLLTNELEPICDATEQRRKMDHTLARFSAVHDKVTEDEKRKRSKRSRYLPWVSEADELDDALTFRTPKTAYNKPVSLEEEAEEPAEKAEEEPPAKPLTRLRAKKLRRAERGVLSAKITAVVVSALILLTSGVGYSAKQWANDQLTEISALDENSSSIQDAALQVGAENFLLVGSDTRAGSNSGDHAGTAQQVHGARSDTVMVAHVSKDHNKVVVTSFPRDLEVNLPTCQRWDSASNNYTNPAPALQNIKLNEVYAVGGPRCMTKMVQQLTGLKINHFTGIDFSGFKDMVNAVGGVQICTTEPIKDSVLGTVIPTVGTQTIAGDAALSYVRARHVIGDPTSDYGRIKRQQRFISSLLRKLMSSDVLLDVGKLKAFVQAFGRATFGDNMNIDQLLVLAQSMQGLDAGKITFLTVPTVGTANERGNEVLRPAQTANLFHAVRDDAPLPGTQPPPPANPPAQAAGEGHPQAMPMPVLETPADSGTKIQVLNAGNTTDGIATKAANALSKSGFDVVLTKNADEKLSKTTIRYGKGHQADANKLAAQVPGAVVEQSASAGAALQLLIAPGFGGVQKKATHAPASNAPLSTIKASDTSCG